MMWQSKPHAAIPPLSGGFQALQESLYRPDQPELHDIYAIVGKVMKSEHD